MKKQTLHLNTKEAAARARHLCSLREMCKFDVSAKLELWGISESDILKIITDLEQEKYICEERYADSFVHDKLLFNHWGKVKLRYMLKQKKIIDSVITKVLGNIDEEKYTDIIRTELVKKIKSIKIKDSYLIKSKLYSYISQKGFETDIAGKIINEIMVR